MKKLLSVFALLLFEFGFSQDWNLKFNVEKSGTTYKVFADNEEFSPMSAAFKFTLMNMKSTLKSDEIIVIPARAKKFLVTTVSVVQANKNYRFQYGVKYNFGDVTLQKFDDSYIYSLPFEKGKTYRIDQGYNGNFSHQNQNSLDFNLKKGDKIFAVREGIVVDTEEKYNQRCLTYECAKMNNKIIILHPDGTFAEYAHLHQNGVEINRGDKVEKGQLIGYSGDTGWTNGPHLHLSVYLNRLEGDRVYIKTKFKTSKSNSTFLEEKKFYTKNY